MDGLSKAYYLKPVKIIRDLVHGYINLTRFDLDLIDTVEFQRLGDIRQLTCQHIYPAARHTRFEHSLGVLELMRDAIKHLNQNGILGEPTWSSGRQRADKNKQTRDEEQPIINDNLQFNAAIAALLHDVGHCPFSHMGETQFDKKVVQAELAKEVEKLKESLGCEGLIKELKEKEKAGSVHEQISCIVILRNFKELLSNLTHKAKAQEEPCELSVDFELIIRSILGLEYKIDSTGKEDEQIKNIIVRLLNSQIFDVDKLDYVMRDSHLTGIGTPSIDRQRLFRNMYLDDKYFLVFTSKAVPALQNMIDARDGLYLYVYNHHAVVYSDFLNTYISRRLLHNARTFLKYAYPGMKEDEAERSLEEIKVSHQMYELGLVPKTYLFSVNAVAQEGRSDSTWISLLRTIHAIYSKYVPEEFPEKLKKKLKKNLKKNVIKGKLKAALDELPLNFTVLPKEAAANAQREKRDYQRASAFSQTKAEDLAEKIANTMLLIHQAMRRRYLKPWWKTVFEFSNFMNHHFRDDRLRKQVGTFICDGVKDSLKADEMRSQIAKHVGYITRRLKGWEKKTGESSGLIEPLNEGDFFVVQRSTNFFSTDTIEKLEIALKDSEILGPPADASRRVDKYYLKKLTNIIPQKKYSSIYAKEGFYVFSKRPSRKALMNCDNPAIPERKHYELLEKIFVFVTASIVSEGEQSFVEKYQGEDPGAENESKKAIYKEFLRFMNWKNPDAGADTVSK